MKKHTLSIGCESEEKLVTKIDETGLLMDIKYLINEFYLATFSDAENSLDIEFNNGQRFRLAVNEIK